jgi:hypothetical protein
MNFGDRFLEAARRGDWDALIDYLERGFEVTPAIREFLVAVLRDEAKRPKRSRPHKARTLTAQLEPAALVFHLKNKGARDPIKQTAEKLGLEERAVHRAVAAHRTMDEEWANFVLLAKGHLTLADIKLDRVTQSGRAVGNRQ